MLIRSPTSTFSHFEKENEMTTPSSFGLRRRVLAGFAVSALCAFGQVHAETYPNRPVKLVIPFAAGGPTDLIGRAVARELELGLGQSVVVDNRGGAGGIPGQTAVARAPADGYTLLFGAAGSLAISPALYKSLPYDVLRDFVPIALIASAPNAILVNSNVSANSFAEFKNAAQKGTLRFSSGGVGSTGHLAAHIAFADAQLVLQHIPFNGSAPAITGFRGKHVDVIVDTVSSMAPLIDSAQGIRAVAQTGERRAESLPDVPTMRELGYSTVVSTWWGVLAPKGTPEDVIKKVNAALESALMKESFKESLRKAGATAAANGSSGSFATFLKEETRRWGAAVKAAGVEAP